MLLGFGMLVFKCYNYKYFKIYHRFVLNINYI